MVLYGYVKTGHLCPYFRETYKYTPAGLLRKQQLLYASISKLQARLLENKKALSTAQYTANKNRLKKRIQKQQNGILYQKEILIAITKQIDAPSENT